VSDVFVAKVILLVALVIYTAFLAMLFGFLACLLLSLAGLCNVDELLDGR
jgi:hypothetical protein